MEVTDTLWQRLVWLFRPGSRPVSQAETAQMAVVAHLQKILRDKDLEVLRLETEVGKLESMNRIKDAEIGLLAAVIVRNQQRVNAETAAAVARIARYTAGKPE
jgi:hypothetical protein